MTQSTLLIAVRLAFGLLALTAVGRQLAIHVHLGFDVVNFFSYFTNLANIFAAVVLIAGGLGAAARREPSALHDVLRGGAAVGMIVVGIVFAALLRNVDLGQLLPWVNAVLHYVMPVAVAVEWLFEPPRTTLGVRQVRLWLAFPFLYLVYILGRGAATGWYPYPFLNPTTVGGYGPVTAYVVAIVVVFVAVGFVVAAVGNMRRRRGATAPS